MVGGDGDREALEECGFNSCFENNLQNEERLSLLRVKEWSIFGLATAGKMCA